MNDSFYITALRTVTAATVNPAAVDSTSLPDPTELAELQDAATPPGQI